jgi:hypothetical protein
VEQGQKEARGSVRECEKGGSVNYQEFLAQKQSRIKTQGFEPGSVPELLFPFQRDLTKWAIRKGKAAIWAGCGLGKTLMQLSWADQVSRYTGKPVLILAPLAVSTQTQEEAKKIDLSVTRYGAGDLQITNYEQLHNVDSSLFSGIVLDESSCLKSFTSKHKNQIIDMFKYTPYKLCCSATPSPNDFTEIGNHSEFLDICSRSEMLSTYFVHDSGETQKWRLKGHAEKEFFKWLATWAVMLNTPSDIGYDDNGFVLPKINYYQHIVKSKIADGFLFHQMASTLNERRQARKESLEERCSLAASLSAGSDEPWLYWCDLNAESTTITQKIHGAAEVTGSMKSDTKESRMIGFSKGDFKKLVTKAKIAQFGMNWQHCNNMVFVGLSDSFEAFYQAVRRCWRFGQKKPVNVHIVISEKEGSVLENIRLKELKAEQMQKKMIECMADISRKEINNTTKQTIEYKPNKKMEVPAWMLSDKNLAKTG